MTGGQRVALGCAIVLLLPGGCFLLLGISSSAGDGLMIGLAILVVSGVLFWAAFSRPAPPPKPGDEP